MMRRSSTPLSPSKGRDVIFVNGYEVQHLRDDLLNPSSSNPLTPPHRSTATWPHDQSEFLKANRLTSPEVFKLKRLALFQRESVTLSKVVSLVPMTTRRHYPGVHRIEILVNGAPYLLGQFRVRE